MKWIGLLCISIGAGHLLAAQSSPDGGGFYRRDPIQCISGADRERVWDDLNASMADLRERGILPGGSLERSDATTMDWPVVPDPGSAHFDISSVSFYVDQRFGPGRLDWNCGSRVYNFHTGTDIDSWPFWWYAMDHDQAHVVAGAAGTIIYKSDGNYDRECDAEGYDWNAVYVRHADGSVAWYGHLKNRSLTSKPVGATVARGEYLGVVGSSGESIAPHLHLELYEYDGSWNLVDPFAGPCNSLNADSRWAEQEPYRNPKVNSLMTHHSPPVFRTCPIPEIPNTKDAFNPGETIHYAAYYRDQINGHTADYRVKRPDGTVVDSWTQTFDGTRYLSYWYFTRSIPVSAQLGTWTLEVKYGNGTYIHEFQVCAAGTSCGCDVPEGLQASSLGTDAALLSWLAVSDATGYAIQGGKVGKTARTERLDGGFTSRYVDVLQPATEYRFRVRATCTTASSDWSSWYEFSTLAIVAR